VLEVKVSPFNIKPVVAEAVPFFVVNVIAPLPAVEVEASRVIPPFPAVEVFDMSVDPLGFDICVIYVLFVLSIILASATFILTLGLAFAIICKTLLNVPFED
jgi:hypothetical protein